MYTSLLLGSSHASMPNTHRPGLAPYLSHLITSRAFSGATSSSLIHKINHQQIPDIHSHWQEILLVNGNDIDSRTLPSIIANSIIALIQTIHHVNPLAHVLVLSIIPLLHSRFSSPAIFHEYRLAINLIISSHLQTVLMAPYHIVDQFLDMTGMANE